MEEVKFNFDDHFQLGIFELMMVDATFCDRACSLLRGEFFKNKYYAYFFDKIKSLREEFGSVPTHVQLRNEIMRFSVEKRETYLQVFERIVKPKMKRDHQYIRSRLTQFCKKALAWQINDKLVRNQNQDPDFLFSEIQRSFEDFANVTFENVATQTVGQLTTMMEQSADESIDLVPTYLPTIDKHLGGGVPRGTLTIGLSGTNVGKSIWLVNWAWHLIKNGFKVFYVNLEGHRNQTMLRLASRALGIPYGRIRRNDLNDIELQKKNEFEKKYRDSIHIFHNSSFGFTIEDLVPIARNKKKEFDFDVVLVDYGQIMGSKKKFDQLRHEMAYVHRGLSALCGELDVVGGTVAQGNRDTQKKNGEGFGLIRMNDISECFEICRAAATVLTLNRSDHDVETDRARILLDKQRDGMVGIMEVCKTNFNRIAFYGDESEGLGFMNYTDYKSEESQSKEE